jgi:hypothetical protein
LLDSQTKEWIDVINPVSFETWSMITKRMPMYFWKSCVGVISA